MMDKNLHIEIESLIVKYLSGEATPSEKAHILSWAKESPENAQQLVDLKNSNEQIEFSKNKLFNSENAFKEFEQKHILTPKTKIRKLYFALSAVAAIALIFVVFNIFVKQPQPQSIILAQANTAIEQVELIDGSTITLNENSSIFCTQTFDKTHRTIYLKGEAFFEIAHDTLHPFIINVNDVYVQVVGTSFNILSDSISKNVLVTVKTGKVKVAYNTQTIFVEAGEQVSFNSSIKKIEPSSQNISNSDAWKTGELNFKDTPLPEIIKVLNKEYHTSFEIGSEELFNCKLNASFKRSDIPSINELLSILIKVDIKEEHGKQVLYRLSKD